MSVYLPLTEVVDPRAGPGLRALDIGCGRGEWLSLLREKGWQASGVDSNASMAEVAQALGIDVSVADAIEYLRGCADDSFSLITAFHVVEHLKHSALTTLLREVQRVLSPGGLVILETPNPENLTVASWSFHMDPTHEKPLPPALLQFLAETAGLKAPAIVRLNSLQREADGSFPSSPLVAMFANGPDYAVIATNGGDQENPLVEAVASFAAQAGEPGPVDVTAILHSARVSEKLSSDVAELSTGLEFLHRQQQLELTEMRAELLSLRRRHDETLERQTKTLEMVVGQQEQVTATLREISGLAASLHSEIQGRRYRASPLSRLLRLSFDDRFWIVRGAKAWLQLKPGSRPRRMMRRGVFRVQEIVQSNPWIRPAAHRALALSPRLQNRVFSILSAPPPVVPRSDEEQLALERLTHAAIVAARLSHHKPSTSSGKPRLAFVSPFPPDRSGIADYSAQLLPELSKFYEIDLVSPTDETSASATDSNIGSRSSSWFEENFSRYDRIVYQFGNSPFHYHMLDLLRKIPGIVALHDFYIGDLINYAEHVGGKSSLLVRTLYESHGFEVAARYNSAPSLLPDIIPKYPLNFPVLAQAQGVIVHSEFARRLAADFYPALDTSDWHVIPLVRASEPLFSRKDAKVDLGFGEDAFIVCSFGHLNSSKKCDVVLDAWQESSLSSDPTCHLIFVGSIVDDEFGTEINRRLASSLGNVRATGYVSADDYQKFLTIADIGVQLRGSSRGETSAAALDCLQFGLPTIVNANGSMADLPDSVVYKLPDDVKSIELAEKFVELRNSYAEAKAVGAKAQHYIEANHSAETVSRRYRDAIELCHEGSSEINNSTKIVQLLKVDDRSRAKPADAIGRLTKELGRIPSRIPQHRLFIDVSATARDDLRTGIQRVVRGLMLELIRNPPIGYRVEPVWLQNGTGAWQYEYARNFTNSTLGIHCPDSKDHVVIPQKSDILLVADYFCAAVSDAHRQGVYNDWKRAGVSIQFVVYDMLPVLRPDWFPPWASPAHKEWSLAIADAGDRLICISNSVAAETRQWLADHDAAGIEVVGWKLGADMAASSPTRGLPDDADTILSTIQEAHSFLMVGTVEPRKGHLQALEAFETLWAKGSQARLVIVGTEGWKGIPAHQSGKLPFTLERLNKHPELGRRLLWLKSVSDEFLDKIYASSRCLLAASEGEGFGLPLIEAARHGIPILARDIPVFREVAGSHAAYFSAHKATEFADAIEHWIRKYEMGECVSPSHMQWATWAQSAELLKKLILPQSRVDGERAFVQH
ncbi:glycosyltransferase [Aureimonas endophytica]|nr:glycosyltransferase [Aureimonas endophytica]